MSKRKKKEDGEAESILEYRKSSDSHNSGHILGIDFSKNAEENELIRLMNSGTPVIAVTGQAGCGKTFTALAAAIDLTRIQRKYRKIYYIREPVEVGHSLGFIPGDLDDKYSVYCAPLYDNLEAISEFSGIPTKSLENEVEAIPPEYTRGRSFVPGSILIVDESQNLSLDSIQTLATRLGKYSMIIFLGSMNQIDLRGKTKENNDFKNALNIFQNIANSGHPDLFAHIELIKSERSDFCSIIDEAFTDYKNQIAAPATK